MHLVGTVMDASPRSSRFVGNARTRCQNRSLSILPEERAEETTSVQLQLIYYLIGSRSYLKKRRSARLMDATGEPRLQRAASLLVRE